MKNLLLFIAATLFMVACMKQVDKSANSVGIAHSITSFDDLFIDATSLAPPFHGVDSGTVVDVYRDSIWTQFGGTITHWTWQFSNIAVRETSLKLYMDGIQIYSAANAQNVGGVRLFTFDDPLGGTFSLSPNWHYIKIRAKVSGASGQRFAVTVAKDSITYFDIDGNPSSVVGEPQTTAGLKIN